MIIKKEMVKPLLDMKFLRVFDLQYAEGRHYYDATRRDMDDLVAIKSGEQFQAMEADAATCYVVIKAKGEEPKLLLHYEYRYPCGQYLLSIPAGLIDKEDKGKEDALLITAKREIKEETGIDVKPTDKVFEINHCVFSTPGFTDESNGLVGVILKLDDLSVLSNSGAEGGENFGDFVLLTKEQAMKVLKSGKDPNGNFYPMYTWGALIWFVTDLWRDNDD